MNISRTEVRELRRYRQFYERYPQIRESPTPVSGELLISSLSFTHIAEFLQIDDETKRVFYEIECIQGRWSVRKLKRQINSLYSERSGLSIDKEKLSIIANQSTEKSKSQLIIRDPYIFEFLGLKSREVMSESHLEVAILPWQGISIKVTFLRGQGGAASL